MLLSVLMSAYIGCKKDYIERALNSVFYEQSLKPDQIVLILDGPVDNELYDFVLSFQSRIVGKCDMIIHSLPISKGFGNALNEGLKLCCGEYIARMDSDDICLPNRFFDQLNYLNERPFLDVTGSWISEIDENGEITRDVLEYPETHEQCLSRFIYSDPLAHPSVMFRTSFFKKSGEYPVNTHFFEDTVMWYQGFINGCIFSNTPKVCLQFRRSTDFYKKRGNIRVLFNLFSYRVNLINPDLGYGYKGNFIAFLYLIMHLAPPFLKKFLYDKLR